jgi:AraC-like DNA-binding protein
MKKIDLLYEQHLVINKHSVLPGGEWTPRSLGWTVIQVQSGVGYWLQPQSSTEIEIGTVLLVAAGTPGRIRASQLNKLSLFSFNVVPGRLTGLIKSGESELLDQIGSQGLRILPPINPIALKLQELRDNPDGDGLFFRLTLLKLFLEAVGTDLKQVTVQRENADAKERLRSFLAQTSPETLLETNFRELARMMHCTPRHLSRAFNETVGMSFRDKRAEIQLSRARDLLANSNFKIVDVALESGYKSLSLFNMMFTRRFGTSPGRWRQQNTVDGRNEAKGAARSYPRIRENTKRLPSPSESVASR